VVESEKSIYREQAKDSGKPEKFWTKSSAADWKSFIPRYACWSKTYIKDDSRSIQDVLNELIAKLGEKTYPSGALCATSSVNSTPVTP